MNAQASILRWMLAGGMVFGFSGCGYIEDLIEDETTNSPADISGFDEGDAVTYGKVATQIGLVDGLVEGFGSGVGGLPTKAVAGTDCPIFDIVGFDPDTYPPGAPQPDSVTMTADYTGSAPGCVDQDTNPLSGTYSVLITGLTDETWPATVDGGLGGFTDVYHWRFDDATLAYNFMDMSAQLPGPVTTTTNGQLQVNVTTDGTGETSKHAVNVGGIRTVFDNGTDALTGLFELVDITKVLPAGSSVSTTNGGFRLTVTLFGYLDVTLTDVVVDEATCPNHPTSGVVSMEGDGGDMVSVDFDDTAPFACDEVDVTKADGTIVTNVVIGDIF
jgi:hypothetical protein